MSEGEGRTFDHDELYLDCGRWRNGELTGSCLKAGTEDCQFCPVARRAAHQRKEG
jgi:hypothetical protein